MKNQWNKTIAIILLLLPGLLLANNNAHHSGVKSNNIVIEMTDNLLIYYPQFKTVDHVVRKMPSYNDTSVIFCCSASFTGQLLKEFKHFNIAGNHVSSGTYYRGYRCRPNTGGFVYYNNQWKFLLHNYNNELKKAAEYHGMGFGQNMIIYNSVTQPSFRKLTSKFVYRALCEYNGKLCIIESRSIVTYKDFISYLEQLKVKHALYLDMGSGWNYAWYHDNNGAIKEIHIRPSSANDYRTNWIVFKR